MFNSAGTCHESAALLCSIFDTTRPIWTVIVTVTACTTPRDGAVLVSAFLGVKEIQFGCGGESYCEEAEGKPSALLLLPWSCIGDALDSCSSQGWSLAYARVQSRCLTLFSKAWASPGRAAPARAPGGRALQRNVGPLSSGSPATAFSVPLVPLGSGGRAALHWYKTQLCWHSCSHTRECFASV